MERPCRRDCPDRRQGCHGHCERERLWKESQRGGEQRRREEQDYVACKRGSIRRMLRRVHLRKKP